jgi:hypothetical protein
MLAHTLAKRLLDMDDIPVVVRDRGATLLEVGGAHDVMAKRHSEHPDTRYWGLWFMAQQGDDKAVKVIELR